MKQDENTLTDFAAMLKRAWWHRPGYEAIGQVLDVFDALGFETKAGMKPVLVHKHRIAGGWHLVFHLPPGIKSADVEAEREHFQEQTGAMVEFKPMDAKLHMDIRTMEMPEMVGYEWQLPTGMHLSLPIGHNGVEVVIVNLPSLPHLIVAGNVGGGKTTFLHTAAVSLIQQGAYVCIIDLKGLDFHHLNTHALVVDTEQGAGEVLEALNKQQDKRKRILQQAKVQKFQQYKGDLPWIVCIIDELAELQDRESQDMLNRLARLCRATGICLIVATQRPSHTLFQRFTDTRMLFAGRLCFSVPKAEDSRLILENDAAAKLPVNVPGRAIWQWDKQVEVQGLYLDVPGAEKILAGIKPGGAIIERRTTRLLPR